ncbi:response regulator [Herbaspirillum sp. LeCh32-8]|uniref:response regulator n=1 Tax=Herbaspirillum sp. LeCh32-8 TaxID=2821356 RepID=UPI001AE2C766|nr:response regulator [Herbaspirillum sp. LeCh32-8]MBP0597516.1 response regulator [Herbaspirillum sp. LeCh32-8]
MNKTALIAASRPDERQALTEWLAINDVDIETVPSGQRAIEHMTHGRPDIVLAQLSMDDMSGLRLAHYLKAHEGFAGVPVILLCRDEREMRLVDGQWPAFIFEAPVNPALISELKRELVN